MDTFFKYGIGCIGLATIGFIDAHIETEAHVLDIYEFDRGNYFAEISHSDFNNKYRTSLIPISSANTKTIIVKYPIWNMDNITEGRIWACLKDLVNLFRIGMACVIVSITFVHDLNSQSLPQSHPDS